MSLWGIAITAFIIVFTVALIRAHFNKKLNLSLLDLVARNGQLSTTKILQLVGGVVGTWIVIKLTLTSGISWEIFSIYLAYVASVDGFSKVISAKYSAGQERQSYRYQPRTYDEPTGSKKTEDL